MQKRKRKNIFIHPVLLAAGGSKRLGYPKQLLKYKSKSLISRSIYIANSITSNPVSIIIGSNALKIRLAIKHQTNNSIIIFNRKWELGISESLKISKKHINPSAKAILILSCDQPFINNKHIDKLIEIWNKNKNKIVVAKYNNTFGIPLILPKKLFYLLDMVTGDQGIKKIVKERKDLLKKVTINSAGIDIDTEEDKKKFL